MKRIDVKIGQMVRGVVIDGERPDHINIKTPYDEFKEILLNSPMDEKLKIWEWINRGVIPAMRFKGKITIEIV